MKNYNDYSQINEATEASSNILTNLAKKYGFGIEYSGYSEPNNLIVKAQKVVSGFFKIYINYDEHQIPYFKLDMRVGGNGTKEISYTSFYKLLTNLNVLQKAYDFGSELITEQFKIMKEMRGK